VEGGYIDISTMHIRESYQGKNPTENEQTPKNEGQERKTGHTNGRSLTGEGG
jgi:hypothetical protein